MSVNASTTVSISPSLDPRPERARGSGSGRWVAWVSSGRSLSPAGRAAARPCRRSVLPWSGAPGRAARPARLAGVRRAAGRSGRCWSAARGSRCSISCRLAWTRGDRLDDARRSGHEANVRWNRRVGLAMAGPAAGAARPRRAPRSTAARAPVVERPRGRQGRGSGLDDAAEVEGVQPVRPLRRGGAVGRCAPTGPGASWSRRCRRRDPASVSTSPAVRSAAIASRSVARETSSRSASSRSEGQGAAERVDPEPDRGRELLDAGLERVVSAHRAQTTSARWAAGSAVTRVSLAGAR